MAKDNEANARAVLALSLAGQGKQPAALREALRARALVKDSQNAMARLPVAIAAARVEAATAPRDAIRALDAARREAEKLGIPRPAFEARRALAEIERRTVPARAATTLAALSKDAASRGFTLFAR
jgi:hypothetical protein